MTTTPPVGFGKVEEVNKDKNGLDIKIELLNPGDRILFELVSIDNKDDSIDVYLKNANVLTRVMSSKSGEISLVDLMSEKNMMALAILSAIPFFGGFARSMIDVGLAQRIGKLSK